MNKLYIVIKNELLRYFISPLAYVYLIAFLILNGLFTIHFGDFFARGQANLISMFVYQPWLYLLFLTGISMRLWAEEFRTKTITQILTQPVSISTLVWGKFFASLIFASIGLALTFPFWITVNILGSPDNGVIFISYIGSFLLAACILSISQTMSALTKNQVIALVLSVIVNLIFFLSGLEFVLSLFRLFAPLPIVDMIASFSFITHYNSIIIGTVELRDLIFFISIIILFNLTSALTISFKTSGTSRLLKSNSRTYYILVFTFFLIGFIGLNILANNCARNIQADFTEEKSFSLTDSAKEILQNLPQNITAKLYYTKDLEERDPNIRILFDKVRAKLEAFRKASNGKFEYIIYNPKALDDIEDIALSDGLQPIPVIANNTNAFFGMTLHNETGQKLVIPFFTNERSNFLEYDIITKVFILNHKKKNLGIISSLPVFETSITYNYITPKWEIINQIEELYNLKQINKKEDFQNLDVLLIIHPENLSPEIVEGITNYTNQGGKSVILLDVATDSPRLFSSVTYDLKASDFADLEKLFGFYFYPNNVVGDLDNSITVDVTTDYSSNPIFTQDVIQFIMKKANMNQDAIETKNLNNIFFVSTSMLSQASKNIEFIPLITTSQNSEALPATVAQKNIHPINVLNNFKPDDIDKVLAAKIISKDPNRPFESIVIADSDFIYERFWGKPITFLDNTYYIPIFDNATFLLNALESLSGETVLIGLQNQTPISRSFTVIDKTRKNSMLTFKQKENQIFVQINETKKQLQEITNKRTFEERTNFTPDELSLIAGIRKNLDNLRQDLAQLKIGQDNEIRKIELKVKFYNIYLIPLIILLLLTIRSLKNLKPKISRFEINKPFIILSISSLAILGSGLLSMHFGTYNYTLDYLNQPTFEKLSDNINDITQIEIESSKNKLVFYKRDGIWLLKGHEEIIVYQERISVLLTTILNSTIFEKKSNRAELMQNFGLIPINNKDSKTIHLSFKNTKGNVIDSFDIGNYDIDLGRGTKAAYIKFDNLFQVWLIKADFINLSTDWQDWTYSSIWNLRFGRFQQYNQITNVDKIANLAKTLLNTYYKSYTKELAKKNKLTTLELLVEGGNKVNIDFYKSDDKIYIHYNFVDISNSKLASLAAFIQEQYFEISETDWIKIKNEL